MAGPFQLSALLLCLWSITLVCSFNLEPRIPIVKRGAPKSHFGYTVAQHQTITKTASGSSFKKSWLLVGAPKDQNLQPGTNRSGALWKCPLTTYTTDCEQVKTDGFKNPETGLYNFDYLNESLAEPAEDEIKDDQWLGVTLKSQGPGGKVLVCAHRYMHKGRGFQWGFGLCYILTQTLDMNDYLEPCRGKPVNEGHQQYGFCQAGTSGLLLEDEAVLGVPGPYTWRGTVHTSNISDNFLLKDKTQYFGPVTENDSPVDKYSYLGYSVTAGRFFGNYMSYVGGAPRANDTGQVVFFSREKIGESLLRVDLILQGEMFASSFGFEVLGVDINGDRHDDLVVGAPFYYTPTQSGAVYVYMNNDGGFTENHPFKKLEVGAAGESRFGFSMTSLGDLNHDGYTDIAIGAPYEGRGAIYIYLGSQIGLPDKPSQVIHAEDMPGIPYDAFGYSLSGGMDLDGNGYPDLLTSSFCSDRVLLIRARPIINIQTKVESQNLQNIDPTKQGCTEDIGSIETCFSFKACFKMDNDAGTRTGLRLKYTIEEISDRPIVRVRFSGGQGNQPSIVERDINLRPEDMGHFICNSETVYLLIESRKVLQPLKFKLSHEIIQREPRPVNEGDAVPDIDDYPILNQQEALRTFEGTFAKDCGDDDVCVSDLDVKGTLDLEKHEKYSRYILRLGEQDAVLLHVEVTNTGEPAYQSSLIVNHHQALRFDPIESKTGSHECTPSKTQVQCYIGNPLTRTSGPLIFSFKESEFPFDSKYIHFTVAANSSSILERPQNPLNFKVEVIKKAEISITGSVDPEQAFYGGEVVGESAIKHMKQIGNEVTHKYVVDNRGPWRVDELQVEVLWPYQVENNKEQGKWLLYMTEMPTVDGIGECEIDPSYVNPLILRHQPFSESGGLTGLEVEGELETTDLPGPDGKIPSKSETLLDVDLEAGGSGGSKVTKTVKTTKKVTSSTTIKKQTSKSSSTKDISASTERTSQGFSSSSSGSSSSSSGSSSQFSSSSGHRETGAPVDDELDGSGYGLETGRQHGRAHSRVSRRVYSTEHKSKFGSSDLGINELDTNFDDEDEDDIVSQHEESHSSTRTSPDGRTTLTESHHESRKVIVKEDSFRDIPGERWNQGGGYRKSDADISQSGTVDIPERRIQYGEESRRQYKGGIDDVTIEGSGLYDIDRSGQNWRTEGGIHRQETIRKTQSGSVSRGFSTSDREGDISHSRSGDLSRGEIARTHSDGSRGFGTSDREETVRRTHSGGISSDRGTHSGDESRTYTREETVSGTHSGGIYGASDGSEQDFRAGIDTYGDRRGETTRTHTGGYDGDVSRYEGSVRTDGSDRSRQDGQARGTHRDTTVESSGPLFRTDGSYRRVYTEDTSRTYGSEDSDRSSIRGVVSSLDGKERQSGSTRIDGYSSGSDIGGSTGNQGYRRTISYGSDRTQVTGDSRTGGYDRSTDHTGIRPDYTSSGRSGERVLTHSGQGRPVDGFEQATFDSTDRDQDQSRFSDQERRGSSRTHFTEYDKFNQESTSRRTHTHDGSGINTRHSIDGDDTRHQAGGPWRSTDNVGDGIKDSRTSHTNLRTTTLDLGGGAGEHSKASWSTHSSGGGSRRTHTYDGSGISTGHGMGDETRQHQSGGSWESSGNVGDGLKYSRTSTNLRTTTLDLSGGDGEHNRASLSTHSAHGGRDSSLEHRGRSFDARTGDFSDVRPDENGTYTRVEVDPETGETIVYTKKVYSRNLQENWDRRPYNERSNLDSSSDTHHTRSRRELTRVKREKELIIKPQAVTDEQTGKTMQVVNLKCDGDFPTAKCFVFRCNIRNLGAKQAASIRIKSRLWNSTLVEDYPRVSYVSIKSKGSLILPKDIRDDQDQSDDVASAETLAYPDLLDQLPPEEVPLWVILVSIFAGLLVLIIIVLILWKLGFFERKRPDPTLSGNLDKDANGY